MANDNPNSGCVTLLLLVSLLFQLVALNDKLDLANQQLEQANQQLEQIQMRQILGGPEAQ